LVDSAKSHIKDGEVILNTNLTDLQVTLWTTQPHHSDGLGF
jgi:hypothetical protein